MEQRSYQSAVRDLNSLQSNANIIKEINANRQNVFKNSIPEMNEYLNMIGYKPEELDKLNIIHITGTKGKGSTAAFCQAILREEKIKTGLFTSPHMMEVRERIRINNQPLEANKFCEYFYYCYDRLVGKKKSIINPYLPGPSYFRFLTLMAFHVFMQERVEATILEVGIGGEYDSTNIIVNPIVCGISHLALDHTNILGDTIKDIAWHKAGIFKSNSIAYTIPDQNKEAMQVLEERAKEKKIELKLCKPLIKYNNHNKIELGLSGTHQQENASLAISLTQEFLSRYKQQKQDFNSIKETTLLGLKKTKWMGRTEKYIDKNNIEWYLDGAHTKESIVCCLEWFIATYDKNKLNYIVFNPAKDRDNILLLNQIYITLLKYNIEINSLILCPNIIGQVDSLDSINHTLNWDQPLLSQYQLKDAWLDLDKDKKICKNEPIIFPTIYKAVEHIKQEKNKCLQVLVTGSLHLVGGVMKVIEHPIE